MRCYNSFESQRRLKLKIVKVKGSFMSNISDAIEYLLKQMLDENEGIVEFKRNDLAEEINCVPSQITYVIKTRFTNDMGYIKESRRGGGGSITIRRVDFNLPHEQLIFQIQTLPESLSQQTAFLILVNLYEQEVINKRELVILKSAISHHALKKMPNIYSDQVRASILMNMLLAIYQQNTQGD